MASAILQRLNKEVLEEEEEPDIDSEDLADAMPIEEEEEEETEEKPKKKSSKKRDRSEEPRSRSPSPTKPAEKKTKKSTVPAIVFSRLCEGPVRHGEVVVDRANFKLYVIRSNTVNVRTFLIPDHGVLEFDEAMRVTDYIHVEQIKNTDLNLSKPVQWTEKLQPVFAGEAHRETCLAGVQDGDADSVRLYPVTLDLHTKIHPLVSTAKGKETKELGQQKSNVLSFAPGRGGSPFAGGELTCRTAMCRWLQVCHAKTTHGAAAAAATGGEPKAKKAAKGGDALHRKPFVACEQTLLAVVSQLLKTRDAGFRKAAVDNGTTVLHEFNSWRSFAAKHYEAHHNKAPDSRAISDSFVAFLTRYTQEYKTIPAAEHVYTLVALAFALTNPQACKLLNNQADVYAKLEETAPASNEMMQF